MLAAEHILNPMTGRYTVRHIGCARAHVTRSVQVTDDLEAVAPLVVALANRYAEYENEGSTVWDRTGERARAP